MRFVVELQRGVHTTLQSLAIAKGTLHTSWYIDFRNNIWESTAFHRVHITRIFDRKSIWAQSWFKMRFPIFDIYVCLPDVMSVPFDI